MITWADISREVILSRKKITSPSSEELHIIYKKFNSVPSQYIFFTYLKLFNYKII